MTVSTNGGDQEDVPEQVRNAITFLIAETIDDLFVTNGALDPTSRRDEPSLSAPSHG